MLYLEDYLEMIEHLPQELRDRFTEMRELDLSVQNSMDSLEKKTRSFFVQCKRGDLQEELADTEFQNLRKEYYKVLEDADEKVTIATQIHELVERYLRRLDSELFKFKCELEADNNGITEILEKRSLEMDGGSSAATALLSVAGLNQKENRYYGGLSAAVAPSGSNSHSAVMGGGAVGIGMGGITVPATPTGATKDNRYRAPKPEKRRDSTSTLQSAVPEKRANLGNSLPAGAPPVAVVRPITPGMGAVLNPATAAVGTPSAVAYNLQQIGGSASTAIAAAASQAIVATQQMQQGRRTASLKASYEAIHGAGGGPTEFWISRDLASAAAASAAGLTGNSSSEKSKKKYAQKKLNTNLAHTVASTNVAPTTTPSALSIASSSSSLSVDSVDMLAGSTANLNVPSLVAAGQHVTASSSTAGSSSIASSNRAALNSTSSVNSLSNSSTTSTALTPGSNITLNENGMVVEQTPEGEWSYDPNEPRYCTCNQVSYGDMVACDNDACPYEWFHYPCVGITQPPKGKWYCPKCTASMRRRGNRKN
ncbi:inhibitor of growth protein 3 isoform X1 [Lucilia sericata]|uniref:inhibitor of growth protein 3 isoform X1 n=1 Tax=Lucilia sericata TaxID=13632 RepID=UPI0018A87D4A|nr:inhibitor of growth protein 3 isoform X1 [Lucilia sericata]